MIKRVTPRINKYILHSPHPKQLAFLMLDDVREVFFGGAGGPGKTDALLMAGLQYADFPGYQGILLRNTYTELSMAGGLMDRAEEWLSGTDAHWSGQDHRWEFPNRASLTFGYLANLQDQSRYKTANFHFIGFDELTTFEEKRYKFMHSRNRRLMTERDIPLRIRSASNPGDRGHLWVKRYFIDTADPAKVFIPAKMEDNPYLDVESYMESLKNVDPILRRQILKGDWTARETGGKFQKEWFTVVEEPPAGGRRVRYWDVAATAPARGKDPDFTVGVLLVRNDEGIFYVEDVKRFQGTPLDVKKLVRQTAMLDGVEVPVVREQEPGASGVEVIDEWRRKVLQGFDFSPDKKNVDKEIRANPVSAMAEAGNIQVVEGDWNEDFLDEIEAFPYGDHDDQVDALSGAFAFLTRHEDDDDMDDVRATSARR